MNINPRQAEYLVYQMLDDSTVKATMKALCIEGPKYYNEPISTHKNITAKWLRELADALEGEQ